MGGTLGWVVDVFDLTLVLFVTGIIGEAFFPRADPVTQLLFVFSSYALTLLARPLGGLIFGHVADRVGRRITMVVTLLGLGLSTALTGLLPTYAQWGLAATAAFVALRLLVGVFVGGEVSGSHLIAIEEAEAGRRGLASGVLQSGYYWGYALAAVAFLGLAAYFGQAFATEGWRYGFYIGLAVALAGILLRLTVGESRPFQDVKRAGRVARVPAAVLLRERGGDFARVLLLMCSIYWVAYATLGFLPTYLSLLKVPNVQRLTALAYGSLLGALLTILGGVLSNRLGRRWAFVAYSALGIALSYPAVLLLHTGDLASMALGVGLLVGIVGMGGGVMLAHIAELFPTRVRGSAVGILWNLANIGSTGSLLLAPVLVRDPATYTALIAVGYVLTIVGALVNRDRTGAPLE